MFDIGGWELLVIAALALIVVGPKDLPKLIRSAGQWVGRARKLAADFQRGMDNAAREADLIDEAQSLKKMGSGVKDSILKVDRDLRDVSSGARPSNGGGLIEDVSARRAAASAHAAAPAKTGATASGPAPAPMKPAAAPMKPAAAADDPVLKDFERGMRGDG